MLILIVDDDEEDRELFREAIRSIDPLILSLSMSDGIEALEYLNNHTSDLPDFIFMDVNMPKMNGRECLDLIKANPRLKDIAIVMLSTTQSTQEITIFKNRGAQFLTKPTSNSDLIRLTRGILKV